MKKIIAAERIILAGWVVSACAALLVISVSAAPFGLNLFGVVILCLGIFVSPGITGGRIGLSLKRMFRVGIFIPLLLLPVLAVFLVKEPFPKGTVLIFFFFIMHQCVFWNIMYAVNRLLYSAAVFLTVLLPILAGSLMMRSLPDAPGVFALSPFGYLRELILHSPALPVTVVFCLIQAAVLAAAVMLRRRQ